MISEEDIKKLDALYDYVEEQKLSSDINEEMYYILDKISSDLNDIIYNQD